MHKAQVHKRMGGQYIYSGSEDSNLQAGSIDLVVHKVDSHSLYVHKKIFEDIFGSIGQEECKEYHPHTLAQYTIHSGSWVVLGVDLHPH